MFATKPDALLTSSKFAGKNRGEERVRLLTPSDNLTVDCEITKTLYVDAINPLD